MFIDLNACNRRLAALDAVGACIAADRAMLITVCNALDLSSVDPAERRRLADRLRAFDAALADCRSERETVARLMEFADDEDGICLVSQIPIVLIA